MQLINALPIHNGNYVKISLTTTTNDAKLLPVDAAGNAPSYYYFQCSLGNAQIRLDSADGLPDNFISKFVLLQGQSFIVRCNGAKWAFVDAIGATPVTVFITALDWQ